MADELERKLAKEGLPKLKASLAIIPTELPRMLDSSFTLTGADAQGKFVPNMGWAGFFQLLKSQSTNRWVELSEEQLEVAVGDGNVIAPELMNERVLDSPAAIESLRDKDGAYIFNLQWAAKERKFHLTTRNLSRQETMQIAAQLTTAYVSMQGDGWRVPYQFDPSSNFLHHLAAERASGSTSPRPPNGGLR